MDVLVGITRLVASDRSNTTKFKSKKLLGSSPFSSGNSSDSSDSDSDGDRDAVTVSSSKLRSLVGKDMMKSAAAMLPKPSAVVKGVMKAGRMVQLPKSVIQAKASQQEGKKSAWQDLPGSKRHPPDANGDPPGASSSEALSAGGGSSAGGASAVKGGFSGSFRLPKSSTVGSRSAPSSAPVHKSLSGSSNASSKKKGGAVKASKSVILSHSKGGVKKTESAMVVPSVGLVSIEPPIKSPRGTPRSSSSSSTSTSTSTSTSGSRVGGGTLWGGDVDEPLLLGGKNVRHSTAGGRLGSGAKEGEGLASGGLEVGKKGGLMNRALDKIRRTISLTGGAKARSHSKSIGGEVDMGDFAAQAEAMLLSGELQKLSADLEGGEDALVASSEPLRTKAVTPPPAFLSRMVDPSRGLVRRRSAGNKEKGEMDKATTTLGDKGGVDPPYRPSQRPKSPLLRSTIKEEGSRDADEFEFMAGLSKGVRAKGGDDMGGESEYDGEEFVWNAKATCGNLRAGK